MWVLKTKGETYYVEHVDCNVPWSTKETPDNPHTKGSIKVKNCLLTIDDSNTAIITNLTESDKIRIRNKEKGITRIIFETNGEMHNALKNKEFKHSPFKKILGSCGSDFVVCDLLDKVETTAASLKYKFKKLEPNSTYYKQYDGDNEYIDEEELSDDSI